MSFQVVALVSGGKDSCYSAMKCEAHGHQVVVLANLYPSKIEEQRDSYMYQTQGWEMLPAIAKCMGLPLEARPIKGRSVNQDLRYEARSDEDEVEDLYWLLHDIKQKYPAVNAVCSGAVLSNYQRSRVENVCERLGLTSLAFLWNRDQKQLLDEMIANCVEAVLVKVCSMGLEQKHVGKNISELRDYFFKLDSDFGFHVCGEGGEYETITLDCPLFRKSRIVLDETRAVTIENRAFSPICVLEIVRYHIEPKECAVVASAATIGSISHRNVAYELGPLVVSRTLRFSKGNHDCPWFVGPIFGKAFEDAMKGLFDSCAGRLDRICFVHLYVSDLSLFGAANKAFEDLFKSQKTPASPPPARATFELEGLGDFSIAVTALVAEKARSRKVLQVRSRSEWAPMCIGPYSQCNVLDERLALVAGQIPLDPPTMNLADDLSLASQLKLAIRHCLRIALDSSINTKKGLGAIVYTNTYRGAKPPRETINIAADGLRTIIAENDDDKFDNASIVPVEHLERFLESKIIFAAVPRLPRDAAVEVEFVSSTDVTCNCGVDIGMLNDKEHSQLASFVRMFFVAGEADAGEIVAHRRGAFDVAIPVQALGMWNRQTRHCEIVPALAYSVCK